MFTSSLPLQHEEEEAEAEEEEEEEELKGLTTNHEHGATLIATASAKPDVPTEPNGEEGVGDRGVYTLQTSPLLMLAGLKGVL